MKTQQVTVGDMWKEARNAFPSTLVPMLSLGNMIKSLQLCLHE